MLSGEVTVDGREDGDSFALCRAHAGTSFTGFRVLKEASVVGETERKGGELFGCGTGHFTS